MENGTDARFFQGPRAVLRWGQERINPAHIPEKPMEIPNQPLQGIQVVSLAVNIPGPVAAAQLTRLGAQVTKVEPPGGDPVAAFSPSLYAQLTQGQTVRTLDLKDPGSRQALDQLLAESDLLLTATRPAALARLGLDWPQLHRRFPQLCHVAIVGYPPPRENEAGHDLTYVADLGLVSPPALPRTLLADLAGASQAVSAALALLLARARGQEASRALVALSQAAETFALPLVHGLTGPGAVLGGGLPGYNLYRAETGWVALAALEPHFWQRLLDALGLASADAADLARIFATRPAQEWEAWARERDIPLAAVRAEK